MVQVVWLHTQDPKKLCPRDQDYFLSGIFWLENIDYIGDLKLETAKSDETLD